MNLVQSLALALALSTIGVSTWAAQHDQKQSPPTTGAPSGPASSKVMPGKPGPDMASMDTQMKAMQAMHDKMMAAKTPEERNALMGEHLKTMQDSMRMMNGTADGMGGMMGDKMGGMKGDMKGGLKGGMKGGLKGGMAARQQMMEKRLDMMQAMMQMMTDRLPATPAK